MSRRTLTSTLRFPADRVSTILNGVQIEKVRQLAMSPVDCSGGGPREILEDGRWGRRLPVGDVDAMATAMAVALDDPSPPDVALRTAKLDVDVAVDAHLHALGASRYASV